MTKKKHVGFYRTEEFIAGKGRNAGKHEFKYEEVSFNGKRFQAVIQGGTLDFRLHGDRLEIIAYKDENTTAPLNLAVRPTCGNVVEILFVAK